MPPPQARSIAPMTSAVQSPSSADADALVGSFERAGYARVEPANLQPAEPFLDLSGEDIRKRMYLTSDPPGASSACGPTSPSRSRAIIWPRLPPASPQGFCYLGPVFRYRDEAPGEFLQAGIESFGRPDKAAADAEMLALGLDATAHYGLAQPVIRIGDVALFSALVAALDLAPAWKRRLIKDFNRKSSLAHDLDRLTISAAGSGRNTRACWRRSPAPTRRARMRWSPICSRSPASPRSAGARSARSPIASSSSRRSARRSRCRARRAR